MAEFKLGRIRFVWKGDWTASNVYYQDDVVAFGGKTYICVTGHTSDTDFFTDLDIVPSKWNLVSDGQTWKGEWTVDTAYVYNDIVSYGARLYIANTNHTSAATVADATDGLEIDIAKWDAYAEGLDWKGDWSVSTRYRINDFVKYGGSTYVCNTLHVSTATAADGLEFDISNWDTFNQGLEFKGEWTSSTRYKYNDLVRYGAGVWICTTAHTSTTDLGTDGANWSQFVEGFQYENDWSPFRGYQPGDVVRYGGNQYIAKTNHTEITPGPQSGTITGIIQDATARATSTNHGLQDGRQIIINDVEGMTEINGLILYINVIDANTFDLYTDVDLVTSLDSSGFTTYTSGGTYTSTSPTEWDLFTEGFRFIGDWNEDSANQHYKVGEVVRLGGFTYVCILDHEEGQQPPNETYWKLLNEGFRWRGEWLDDQEYYEGDVVRYGDNSYYCTLYHISEGDDYSTATLVQPGGGNEGSRPDLADSGQYWSVIAIGSEASVLTTAGDLVYYSGSAPTRLPVGLEGQVLQVGSTGIPEWEFLQTIEDIYYVSEHGIDRPFPESGGSVDRPFKSIRYACERIEEGPKNPNAQYLLEMNRVFIQEEVGSWINYQIANAGGSGIWNNFVYGEDNCKRDVGYIVDRLIWDIGHGGNLKSRAAALSFVNGFSANGEFSDASEDKVYGGAGLAGEATQSVAAYNYMLTVVDAILKNEAPSAIYQNVTDDSTAIVDQFTSTTLVSETGVYTKIQSLVKIITDTITAGDTSAVPARDIPQTLVKVSTGEHYEVLPIRVPAYCAILGDELRSTKIIAAGKTTPATDTPNTVATFDRIAEVVGDIVVGTSITASNGNTEPQDQNWPYAVTAQETVVESLVDMMKYQIDYGLKTMSAGYYTDPTGYSATLENARENIIANKDFLKAEVIAFLDTEYPTLKYGKTDSRRDTGFIIDSLIYDLTYGGNSMAVIAGLSYWDGDDQTYDQLPASLKTECIASINYLRTTAESVAGNTLIVSPKQAEVEQVLAGIAGSTTEIANNIEDIIDIINNGPDAVGTTTTLVNPTLADGVNSTTALISASNALVAAEDTVIQNVIDDLNVVAWHTDWAVDSTSLTTTQFRIYVGKHSLVHTYVSGGTVTKANGTVLAVTNFVYDNVTGYAIVTTGTHGLSAGDIVNIESITVSCNSGSGASNTVFPSATSTQSGITKVKYLQIKCIRDIRKILEAVRFDFALNSNYRTLKAAHAYLRKTAIEVYTGNQKTITRDAITNALTTEAIANVASDATAITRITASARIIDAVIFGATNEGSVCVTADQNRYYAKLQLERNRDFIKAEIAAWIDVQIAGAASGSIWENYTYNEALCARDVDYYIDALKYDLMWPGNYASRYVARFYNNSVTGSQEEDMFYLRDATGVRNSTLQGLSGDLLPENTYGYSKVSAGAYCSLDPGWGPDDFRTWIITRSPYIQGVTTFGTAATGQKIDGALHNGGNDSMVSNDFTQVISDGIGAHILNNGRAELVSVFTYYSHIGYLAETGGRVRATNGNNSYGDFGSVATGVDPDETAVTAVVDNRTQYNATISQINTDNVQLLNVEYTHAGNDYTEATLNIFGPGSNEVVVADEFRDGGFNYAYVDQDADPDIALGGSGYIISSNVAQSGSTTGLFLSATDGSLSSAYPGMKIYIIGAAGIGQYAIINTYNAGTKEATVIRESDGVAGWDHVVPGTPIVAPNSSSTYQIEPRVAITAPTNSSNSITMPTSTTWYDVEWINTAAQYTGVSTTGGNGSGATFDITRNGSKYYLDINAAGTGYSRLDTLTIVGTNVGGATTANDITITVTTVNSVTGAIVDFDFAGTAQAGKFLAVGAGTNGAVSIDGETWTSEVLPTLPGGNWASIADGLQDDGSSTFLPSAVLVIADGDGTVAYSNDSDTWLTSSLPGSFNATGENTVAFGQIDNVTARFVVISDADQDVAYSDNGGQTWSITGTALPANGFGEMAYGAGKFVAINSGTTSAAYSEDGISWTGVTAPAAFAAVTDIVWGNGKFVALGGTNGIMYSLDGVTWYENTLTLPLPATERKLAYGQGTFVITSDDTDQVQYSHDGLYWQSYTLTGTATTGGFNAIAFGNPAQEGKFVMILPGAGTSGKYAKINTPAKGRASVANEQVFAIRITEPGSGYTSAPTITITDPNNVDDVVLVPQIGNGVLANPTFNNRGTGFTSATAEVDAQNSNGNANFPQAGAFIAVRRLTSRPVNGSNVEFDSLPGRFFKLVNTVSFIGSNDGSYTGFLQVSPNVAVDEDLPNGDPVELRIRFSQVRLTGHDFLDIGTGGFADTNYPGVPLNAPSQVKETSDFNGGRVFYTATDQDGNFRVGDLFTIEQSTGVATLNADAFNIAGLQELSLGEVTLGGNSASITEFSTDPFFTANSDTVVPTQRAVKAYIESQIGGGGATLNVNSVTAGDIFIGADTITTLSGSPININANVVFTGTVLGLPLAYNYFLR
jgi:hypothetical protein